MTSTGTFYTNSEHVTGLEELLVYNVHVLVNSLYVCFNVLFFFVVVCVYVFLFFSFLVFCVVLLFVVVERPTSLQEILLVILLQGETT